MRMLRYPAAAVAMALVVAIPARADHPATLAGHYQLNGVMETGSELLMNPDGTFQWYLVYGALDLFAEGTWNADKGVVTLTATKDEKAPPPGFDTLALTVRGSKLVPPDGRGAYEKDGDAPAAPEDVAGNAANAAETPN